MKKIAQLLAISMIVFIQSCDENTSDILDCGVDDPLKELNWLSELSNGLDKSTQPAGSSITMYAYKGALVFEVNSCIGCADNLVSVYSCEGEVICEFGGIGGLNTCKDFSKEAINPVLLYSSTCDKVAIINKTLYDGESHFFNLISTEITGDCMNVEYSSSGCSGDSWNMSLYDAGVVMESFPVRRNIKLVLENQELCLAVFTKTISFDLTPLQVEGNGIVLLNLKGQDTSLHYLYE